MPLFAVSFLAPGAAAPHLTNRGCSQEKMDHNAVRENPLGTF